MMPIILWRFDMLRDLPVFPHDAANCSVLIHDNSGVCGDRQWRLRWQVVLINSPLADRVG